jgi:hypothetical protein
MPEQISKYPEVTLKVLKGTGAVCGEGAPQKILRQCPAERFCSLPGGEICVYGIKEIPQMTQITARELAQVVCPRAQGSGAISAGMSGVEGIMLGAVFVAGLVLGRSWPKPRTSGPGSHD